MNVVSDIMSSCVSILLTAILYMPGAFSYQGFPVHGLDTLLIAKRGGDNSDWQVAFKGRGFEEVTYAKRHENVVLKCEAGGSPSPTLHWLKNGVRIQQGIERDYLDDEAYFEEKATPQHQPMLRLGKVRAKLYLDCVSERDEAEYTCVAETPLERITQSTVLKLRKELPRHSRESCLTKKAFRGEPARIHLWTALRVEFQGAAVQLFCRAEGYPKPKCTWRYTEMGDVINDDDKHKLLPNGDLLINKLSWHENMGEYYCACENEVGVDEVSTFLYPTTME